MGAAFIQNACPSMQVSIPFRLSNVPSSSEFIVAGFRLASVPEPSSLVLTMLASGVVLIRRKR
jgi:hypothetical protein